MTDRNPSADPASYRRNPDADFPPPNAIEAEEAYRMMVRIGIERVEVHPACDLVVLLNHTELYHWEGGNEYPRCWTLGI